MNILKELKDKMDDELLLKEEDTNNNNNNGEEDEWADVEEREEEEEQEASKESKARIRLETESKINGIIKNLTFEVNFRDMADRINDEVDGVVLTREKAHQLFSIIQDLMGY